MVLVIQVDQALAQVDDRLGLLLVGLDLNETLNGFLKAIFDSGHRLRRCVDRLSRLQ